MTSIPTITDELNALWQWVKRHWVLLTILLIVAAAGLPIIEQTTSMGIGLRDDSFSYFSGADGLLAGAGYARFTQLDGWKPLTNFPPLYSALLALPQLIGLEATAGARLIAGLSFAATAFLASLLVYWSTQSLPTSLLTSGLILFSPSLLEVNSWALSEGPYLALMTLSLFLLSILIQERSPGILLISANIAVLSLAALTRYAGVALIGLSGLAILLLKGRSHLKLVLSLPAASSVPLLMFIARNWLVADSATNRPLPSWHPPTTENMMEGAETIAGWFIPHLWTENLWLPAWGFAIFAVPVLVVLIWFSILQFQEYGQISRKPRGSKVASWPLLAHWWVYLAFILLSVSFLDRLIPLNARILSPLQITLLLLLPLWLAEMAGAVENLWPSKSILWLSVITIILIQGLRGLPAMRSLNEAGMGFNSPVWRSARIIEVVNELPDRPIYTNNVPALYFLVDRNASFIPARYDPAGDRSRQDYQDELGEMRNQLEHEDGFIVLMGWPPKNRVEPEHLADLTAGLNLVAETRDGLIYCACEKKAGVAH